MRTLVYFFLLGGILFFQSCQSTEETQTTNHETNTPTSSKDALVVDSTESVMTAEEFVNTPFMLSVHGSEQWDIEEHLDAHDDTIDTIQTLKFRKSIVHLKNNNFLDATLHDQEISLIHDIHVGMTRTQFENCFDHLEPHNDHPHVVIGDSLIQMSCCTKDDHHPHWKFQFNEDLLTEIKYDLDYVTIAPKTSF